jgi:hypothetical protein
MKNKKERLEVVLEIAKKLREFPTNQRTGDTIDLYNGYYDAIHEIKDVFNQYVNQDDNQPKQLIPFSGKIDFPELRRQIEYILPIKKEATSLFVLRN